MTDRVVRVGTLRLPIAGAYRPRVTLYRLPNGQRLWCLRLWEGDGPVRRCVSTAVLLSYVRRSRLTAVEEEIHRLTREASALDGSP
ncbi:MAG: hypothetical protein L3K09_03320 [Thermoplasmata archaeon]|nr:hypothetical protein [Thermoplasmata archaeon]